MEKKKISLDELKNVLTPREMRNVKGGSNGQCCSYDALRNAIVCGGPPCDPYAHVNDGCSWPFWCEA